MYTDIYVYIYIQDDFSPVHRRRSWRSGILKLSGIGFRVLGFEGDFNGLIFRKVH